MEIALCVKKKWALEMVKRSGFLEISQHLGFKVSRVDRGLPWLQFEVCFLRLPPGIQERRRQPLPGLCPHKIVNSRHHPAAGVRLSGL